MQYALDYRGSPISDSLNLPSPIFVLFFLVRSVCRLIAIALTILYESMSYSRDSLLCAENILIIAGTRENSRKKTDAQKCII